MLPFLYICKVYNLMHNSHPPRTYSPQGHPIHKGGLLMSMMECCMCHKLADARALRRCGDCGRAICDECAERNQGLCDDCAAAE